MDPPSYDEVKVLSIGYVQSATASEGPSGSSPSNDKLPTAPPPSYGESANLPYPYPVLIPPTQSANVQAYQPTPAAHTESAHAHAVHVEGAYPQRVYTAQIQSAHTETVYNHQPVVVVQTQPCTFFGDVPCRTRCPYCQQEVNTQVAFKPGMVAWAMCILFTLLGLICGCCLIPFLVNGFQDAHHSCPSCHAHIHTTHRK